MMLAMTRRRHRSALALLGALTVACSGDPAAPLPAEPVPAVGRYEMQTANGQPLPATIFEGMLELEEGGEFHLRIEVPTGFVEIQEGGRYRQQLTLVAYIDGVPDQAGAALWVDRGTVHPVGDVFRFVSEYIQHVEFTAGYGERRLDVSQDVLRHFLGESQLTHFSFVR